MPPSAFGDGGLSPELASLHEQLKSDLDDDEDDEDGDDELDVVKNGAKPTLAQLHSRSPGLLPAVVPPMIANLPADKQQGVQALMQGVC